jgi:deazaflavin-dependent oxidoreductase (nitroreductase family)
VGIIQQLQYELPRPNAAQRALWRISYSRPGAWLFARTLHRIDTEALRISRGRITVAGLLAGVPVLTISTTGARTGIRRTTPVIGVPFGEDIAVIGTRFGQQGTPGWYYNLCADPSAEVSYRHRCVNASAREAGDAERQFIWAQAKRIYAGYEAYARRAEDRKIRIMVLTA